MIGSSHVSQRYSTVGYVAAYFGLCVPQDPLATHILARLVGHDVQREVCAQPWKANKLSGEKYPSQVSVLLAVWLCKMYRHARKGYMKPAAPSANSPRSSYPLNLSTHLHPCFLPSGMWSWKHKCSRFLKLSCKGKVPSQEAALQAFGAPEIVHDGTT